MSATKQDSVILTKVQDNEAVSSDRLKHEPRHARVDNAKDSSNREQLARIVAFLNKDNQKREQNDDNRLGDADKESYKLKDVLNLALNKYNPKTAYDGQKDDHIPPVEVRVHVIKNPEILKEYIKGLRKRNKSTSSDSTEIDSDSLDLDRSLNSHDDVRRNAQFRVDKGKSNEIEDDQSMKTITSASAEISVEMSKQLQKSPFEIDKSHTERKRSEVKKRNRGNAKKEKSFYARSHQWKKNRANDNPTDPWDKITVTLNRMQDNSNENEESDNAVSTKKTKKQWGEYDKGIKDKFNADREQNAWEMKSKKGKQKGKENSWENKDVQWKPSSKAFDWYNDKAKEKVVNKNDLDDKWYERPLKKKTFGNEWDMSKDKAKKAEADSWHDVGLEDPLKTTRKSWQRSDQKRSQGSYDKPYVPKKDQRASGGGFQGRTSIPFVGRQGIYEDK